jgi:RND family efflux transporter MFP subunit
MSGTRKGKWGIAAVVLVVVLGGWFALYGRKMLDENDQKEEAAERAVQTAQRRDILSKLLLTGEIVPAFQVEIKPEVGGKVKTIDVHAGEQVKSGQLLLTIDDRDLLTELEGADREVKGAKLEVEKSRGNYDRAAKLHEEKLISKEIFVNLKADYDLAMNAFDKAESRRKTVEDKLRKTKIVAPADGTVLDVLVNPGAVVSAAASVNSGTIAMQFADLSKLLIETHVNQVDASKLQVGQEMVVNTVRDEDKPITARIEFIAPLATVKNNIKGFEVQAVIQTPDSHLKPGMSVSTTVPVASVHGAVAIPISAVFREKGTRVVYVRKGETTEKRMVTIGITDLSYAEVVSGLQEGEQILLVEPSGFPDASS